MFDIIDNFHDNIMREGLKDETIETLQELLARCLEDELFEIARVVQLEIESRGV